MIGSTSLRTSNLRFSYRSPSRDKRLEDAVKYRVRSQSFGFAFEIQNDSMTKRLPGYRREVRNADVVAPGQQGAGFCSEYYCLAASRAGAVTNVFLDRLWSFVM